MSDIPRRESPQYLNDDTQRPPLFSQRREIARIVSWLRSERFKCDRSVFEFRLAAEEIAEWLEDGTYLRERPSLESSSPESQEKP